MSPVDGTPVIAHAIQLAIAPVFLLTGIAALLAVRSRLDELYERAVADAWVAEPGRSRALGAPNNTGRQRRRIGPV